MKTKLLPPDLNCDVLVIGSGIAGINAAVNAAESGCKVILLSKGSLFSGSSFYPGTWGLGLIGPEDEDDIPNLEKSIKNIGCGMTNDKLVHAFVTGIPAALETIRRRGVKLRTANQKNQREFIPCFDYKHRDWNGLEFESVREVFSSLIKDLGITVLENCEVLKLEKKENRITGAVFYDGNEVKFLSSKSTVLASGGYGSLFQYHLCTDDVIGSGQALALNAGCSLINMEFMQMMPGYIYPAPKTVFNEKTFRFTRIYHSDGTPLLPEADSERLLDIRSGHGPFTSRLDSKVVDTEIFKDFLHNRDGVEIQYNDELRTNPPEFVTTYFDWLKESKGLTVDDPIHVGIFAHAANGGIKIKEDTSTGINGLFAAGEVTGGMHGADRIGGLSTANGLVFGQKAGIAAAKYAKAAEKNQDNAVFEMMTCTNENELVARLQDTMFRNAMVIRTQEGLNSALNEVRQINTEICTSEYPTDHDVAAYYRMQLRLITAESILKSAQARKESRGSHYRTDYPEQSDAFNKCYVVTKTDEINVHLESDT